MGCFHILESSSAGNSAVLQTCFSTVLIDAGLSSRKLETGLAKIGLSLEAIDAVFLTHEHQDHAAGLLGLSRWPQLNIFANRDTSEALQQRLNPRIQWNFFDTGTTFAFQDLIVSTLRLPHDACDPVGYVFRWGSEDLFAPAGSLAWMLDLGYIPEAVGNAIQNVEVLVIESNHDLALLDRDRRRPFSVKQRVRGRHGHLSNHDLLEWFKRVDQPYWRQVYLAHLSRDCNDPVLVQQAFAPFETHRCSITVVDPQNGGPPPYAFHW